MHPDRVTTKEFLGLIDGEPGTQAMPLVERLLGGRGNSLFGGAGLAAGVIGLETASGRSPVWVTGQYVATSSPPDVLEFSTELLANGRSVSQGRVTGTSGDRHVISLLGACGSRHENHRGIWQSMPHAAPPADCLPVERFADTESMHRHVDIRMAEGMFGFTETGTPTGTERALFWAQMPDVHHDAAALAIIADYMPSAVGNSLAERVHCTSLDNTIRFAGPIEPGGQDEWVLCENRIEFVGAGFANGTGFLWSQSGQLLATASQSMTVSQPRD